MRAMMLSFWTCTHAGFFQMYARARDSFSVVPMGGALPSLDPDIGVRVLGRFGMLGGMDLDRLIEITPVLIRLIFAALCLAIFVFVILAILHTPREIRKNRAVLTQILSVLRSIDRSK